MIDSGNAVHHPIPGAQRLGQVDLERTVRTWSAEEPPVRLLAPFIAHRLPLEIVNGKHGTAGLLGSLPPGPMRGWQQPDAAPSAQTTDRKDVYRSVRSASQRVRSQAVAHRETQGRAESCQWAHQLLLALGLDELAQVPLTSIAWRRIADVSKTHPELDSAHAATASMPRR